MAREDKILKVFLSDPLLKEKYEVDSEEFTNVEIASHSKVPIVRAIAMIISGLNPDNEMNEKAIYQQVISYLNKTAE